MKYKINNIDIDLSPGHTLPTYQQQYKLYDQFLPHLAKYLKGTVVDVGANIGALAVAMASRNPDLKFICIEPSTYFFPYLENNTKLVPNKIKCVQDKIGMKHTKLEDYLDMVNIALVKIDVDGYDWDVLNSYGFIQTPPLFFEMDFQNKEQFVEYGKTLADLKAIGYKHFYLFDNFGGFCMYTNAIKDINKLNEYVWRMKQGHSHTTVYYFDVLACAEKDVEIANNAIDTYSQI